MAESKHFNKIVVIVLIITLAFTGGLLALAKSGKVSTQMPEYEDKLFGSGIISIEIEADPEAWQEMLDNATAEEYIPCTVTVNGTTYQEVGVRPKGNSSLTQVANSDSDRYSLRLKFDKYVKGQTCFGLSTFVVNNMSGDATYMKEYLSFDIMNFSGVESALFEYANVSVNGQAWGFYLAMEAYDEEFMARTYGDASGELYSVKMSFGRGAEDDNRDGGQGQFPQGPGGGGEEPPNGITPGNQEVPGGGTVPKNEADENKDFRGDLGNGKGGGMGAGSTGGSLEYTDDNPESYPAIFDNAVTKVNSKDKQRLIKALKALAEGGNLETYFDVDETLRYFAAHTVVVNLDSYVSNMAQNYFLHEENGKVSILPWDYGLAFGGFQSGSASDVVNFPIDTPVSGVELSERPLLAKLLENDEYKAKYHEYLQEIVTGYFDSGKFEETIASLDAKIGTYVENDPSAFYAYEEYKDSVKALTEIGLFRAKSIQGQLDGTIPSTTEGQKADSSALIFTEGIDMSALGGMGGGGRGGDQNKGGFGQPEQEGGFRQENMPDQESMRQAMQLIQENSGEITEEVKAQLTELGITEEQISMFEEMAAGGPGQMQRGEGGDIKAPAGGPASAIGGENERKVAGQINWGMWAGLGGILAASLSFAFLWRKRI